MADAFTSKPGDILQHFISREYVEPLTGERRTKTDFAEFLLHDSSGNRVPITDQQVAEIQAERARTKRLQQGRSVEGVDLDANMLSSFLNATAQGVSDLTSSPVDVYAGLTGSESAQRMAQALQAEKEARFPINPKYEFINAIGSGLGSITAALPALAIPGLATPAIALMTGAAFGEGRNRYRSWARENNQAYDRATELFVGTGYGAAATLSEAVGLNVILKSVHRAPVMSLANIGKAVMSGDKGMLKAGLESAGILPAIYEAGQEITEGMLDQLINKVYDEHAGIFDELTQNAAGGLAGGLALGFLGGRVQHARLQHKLKDTTNKDISGMQNAADRNVYWAYEQLYPEIKSRGLGSPQERLLIGSAYKLYNQASMLEDQVFRAHIGLPEKTSGLFKLSGTKEVAGKRSLRSIISETVSQKQVQGETPVVAPENEARIALVNSISQDAQQALAVVQDRKAALTSAVAKGQRTLKQMLQKAQTAEARPAEAVKASQQQAFDRIQFDIAAKALALKKTLDRVGAVARNAQAFAVLTDEEVAELWPDDAIRGKAIQRKNEIASDPFFAAITEADKMAELVGNAEDKAALADALVVDKEQLKAAMKDFLAFSKNLEASRDPSTVQGAPVVDTDEKLALLQQDEAIELAEAVVDDEALAEAEDMLNEDIITRLALGEDTMQGYIEELGLGDYSLQDLQDLGYNVHDIQEIGDDADYEFQFSARLGKEFQLTQREPAKSKPQSIQEAFAKIKVKLPKQLADSIILAEVKDEHPEATIARIQAQMLSDEAKYSVYEFIINNERDESQGAYTIINDGGTQRPLIYLSDRAALDGADGLRVLYHEIAHAYLDNEFANLNRGTQLKMLESILGIPYPAIGELTLEQFMRITNPDKAFVSLLGIREYAKTKIKDITNPDTLSDIKYLTQPHEILARAAESILLGTEESLQIDRIKALLPNDIVIKAVRFLTTAYQVLTGGIGEQTDFKAWANQKFSGKSKYKDNLTQAILSRTEGDPDEKTLAIMFNNLVRTGMVRGIVKSPTQLFAHVRNPETGEVTQESINGMIDHQKRIIHISPSVQWNTVGHEAFHGLVRALGMNHPVVKRGLKITNGNIEELADLVGDYYAARYMNKSLWQRIRMFLRTLWISSVGRFGFMQSDKQVIAAINGKIENFAGYKVNPEMRYPYREFQVKASDGITPTVRGLAGQDPESAKIIAELGEQFQNKEVVKDFVGRMMAKSQSKTFKQIVKDAMKILTNGKEFETLWKRITKSAMHPNNPSLGFTPTAAQLTAMMEMIYQARSQYNSAVANSRGEAEINAIRAQHKLFIAMFNGMTSETGRSLVTVKYLKDRFKIQGIKFSSRFAEAVSNADMSDPDEFYRAMNFVDDPTSLDWIREIYLNGLLSNPATLFMLNPGVNAMTYASVLTVNPLLRGSVDWLLTKVGMQGSRTRFALEVIGSQKYLDVKSMKARRSEEFLHIMRTGEARTDTKLAYETVWQPHVSAAKRAGMPKVDAALNLPGRFMMSVDAWFKIALEERFRLSHAYRQAGLESDGNAERFAELFEKYRLEPTEDIKTKAAQDAGRAMYAGKPGPVVRAFNRVREEHKILSMFPMPFLTTIAAIAKVGVKLTPGVGAFYNAPGLRRYIEAHRTVIQVVLPDPKKPGDTIIREFKGSIRPGIGNIEKLKAAAKKKYPDAINMVVSAGTHKGIKREQHSGSVPLTDFFADQVAGLMITAALWWAFGGEDEDGDPYITGPRSRDPGKRELMEARGISPWSVNLQAVFPAMEKPTWLDYSRLDPIALPIKILATGLQFAREMKTAEDQDQLLRGMVDDISIAIRDSTPLSGMFTMFGSSFDRIQQTFERLPSNLFPYSGARRAIVKAAMKERKARDREIDATWHNTLEDFGQVTLFGIGPESWDGVTEINALGEPVKSQRDLWQFWNPFHIYGEETDEVEQVMSQLDLSPRLPRRKITIGNAEYKLEKDLYWQYVAAYGKASKEAARKLIQRPYFKSIQSYDRKALLLNKVMQRAEQQVLKKLKAQIRREGQAGLGLQQ